MLILEAIQHHAKQRAKSMALQDLEQTLTYDELNKAIQHAACWLPSKPGLTVGIHLHNSNLWAMLDLALLYQRINCVPLASFFSKEQCQYIVKDARINVIYTDNPAHWRDYHVSKQSLLGYNFYSVDILKPEKKHTPYVGKVTYTSGSTGQPKGVCLSEQALTSVAQSLKHEILTQGTPRYVSCLPLAVLLENVAGLYTTLLLGGCYHMFSPRETSPGFFPWPGLVSHIVEKELSHTVLVPEQLKALIEHLKKSNEKLNTMKFIGVGSAPVPEQLIKQAETLGLAVFQGYGLSEAGSVVALNTPTHNRIGSTGRILPHVSVTIAEDNEILVHKSPWSGYFGKPKTTVLHTGDLGRIDPDGYLYVEGRKKNVIVTTQGRNISPEWIESLLLGHKELKQAMICSYDDLTLTALLVPQNEKENTSKLSALVKSINNTLPLYAQIKHWYSVAPFTTRNGLLTPNGKVIRQNIKQQYQMMGAQI